MFSLRVAMEAGMQGGGGGGEGREGGMEEEVERITISYS